MRQILTKLKKHYSSFLEKLPIDSWAYRLPRFYLRLFLLGLILVGLNYSYLNGLTYCSGMFGGNFCSPIGIYLIAFASLPGYGLVNALLPNVFANNDSLYSLTVFLITILIYGIVGYLLDKKKIVKTKSSLLIIGLFLVLLIALITLISYLRG